MMRADLKSLIHVAILVQLRRWAHRGIEAALISGAYAAEALLPGLLAKPPPDPGRFRKKAA